MTQLQKGSPYGCAKCGHRFTVCSTGEAQQIREIASRAEAVTGTAMELCPSCRAEFIAWSDARNERARDELARNGMSSRVKCRHCGASIELRGEAWCDPDGFPACVKGSIEDQAPLPARPGFRLIRVTEPLLHEPMPAGLRGAV